MILLNGTLLVLATASIVASTWLLACWRKASFVAGTLRTQNSYKYEGRDGKVGSQVTVDGGWQAGIWRQGEWGGKEMEELVLYG